MKKFIKESLVLVIMFITIVGNANEFPLLTKEKTKKVTHFILEDVREGSILSIKDRNGLILYKELIKESGDYSKGFDLTVLPDANYYFELDQEVHIKIVPFEVASSVVTFDKEQEYTFFKPVVYLKKGKIYISKLTFENEFLDIKILAADSNEIVLSERVIKEGDLLGKIYDFSTSEKGVYTFVIKANGRKFIKDIKI